MNMLGYDLLHFTFCDCFNDDILIDWWWYVGTVVIHWNLDHANHIYHLWTRDTMFFHKNRSMNECKGCPLILRHVVPRPAQIQNTTDRTLPPARKNLREAAFISEHWSRLIQNQPTVAEYWQVGGERRHSRCLCLWRWRLHEQWACIGAASFPPNASRQKLTWGLLWLLTSL